MTFRYIPVFAAAILTLACFAPVCSGDAAAEAEQRLLTDIKYLASDELEGRGVGLKGLDVAADYIRDEFAKAGLAVNAVGGGPFQTFTMSTGAVLGSPNALELAGPDNKKLTLAANTDFVPQSYGGSGAFLGELVFCGYGIEAPDKNFDEYAGIDLKGKVALIMRRVPQQGNSQGSFTEARRGMSQHAELRTKLDRAYTRGAVAVLFINDPYTGRNELEQAKKQVSNLAQAVATAAEEFEAVDAMDADKIAAARKKLSDEVAKYKAGKGHLGKEEPDTLMKFGYGGHDAIRNLPVLHISRAICDQENCSTARRRPGSRAARPRWDWPDRASQSRSSAGLRSRSRCSRESRRWRHRSHRAGTRAGTEDRRRVRRTAGHRASASQSWRPRAAGSRVWKRCHS